MANGIESYIEQNFNNQKYDELYSFLATKYLKKYKLGKFDDFIGKVNEEFASNGGLTTVRYFDEIHHLTRNYFQAHMCVYTLFEKSYADDFPFVLRIKDIKRNDGSFGLKVVVFYPPNFSTSKNYSFGETKARLDSLEGGTRKVILDEEDYAKVKKWFADCIGGVSNLESLVSACNFTGLTQVEYYYSKLRIYSVQTKGSELIYNLGRLKDLPQNQQNACKFINDLANSKNIPHSYSLLMESVAFGTLHSFGTEDSRILGYVIINKPTLHIVPVSKSQQFRPIESVFSADEVANYRNACRVLSIFPSLHIPVEGTLPSNEEEEDSFVLYRRKILSQGLEPQKMSQEKKWSLPTDIPKPIKVKRVERSPFPPEQIVKKSQPTSTQKPKEETPKGFEATLKGIFGLGK